MIDPPLDGSRRIHKSWGEYLYPYKATGGFRVEIAEGAEMTRFGDDHCDSVVSIWQRDKTRRQGPESGEIPQDVIVDDQ